MVLNLYILIDILPRTQKMGHITQVLIRLNLLPVEYQSQYRLILYVCKALHGLAPSYLTELVKPCVPSRSLLSQSASLL